MVDLEYVKKRKRKRAAAITSAISSMGLAVLILVSFLGSKVGVYTVGLKNNEVVLTLSATSDFKEKSSYLRVEDVAPLSTYCYQQFKNKEGQLDFSDIDNEHTSYLDRANRDPDGNVVDVPFFKYTFFVKNIGTTTAMYNMSLRITENTPDKVTGKYLDDILRVILIEDSDWVNFRVFALKSTYGTHYDPATGKETDQEYVCGEPLQLNYAGLAERFLSADVIGQNKVVNFKENEVHQYTLLYWLEGDDNECQDPQPREAQIRLGVEIDAYEN